MNSYILEKMIKNHIREKIMQNYIYQIGRLDQSMGPKKFEFKIDEEKKINIESCLSSFALKEYLEKGKNIKDIKIVLAYPISAFFNPSISRSEDLNDEFKKIIKEVNEDESKKGEYLTNPYSFYCQHPHIKDKKKEEVDFFILHSIGSYNRIYFESKFEDIVFDILIDMIKRITPVEDIIKNEYKESFEDINLYIDVSSGHNIYISALLEATKIFQQYFYLLNIFQKRKLYVNLVICDPILTQNGPYDMHFDYELKAGNVLISHLTAKEIVDNIVARRVFQQLENINLSEFRNKKNKLSNILFSYGYIFSSLKNGIPLALYQIEFSKIDEVIDSFLDILNYFKMQLCKSWLKGADLYYDDFLKSLYSIAFIFSYLKMAEEKGIKFKEYAYLDEINNNFSDDKNSLLNILGYTVAKQVIANELVGYGIENKKFDNKSVIDRIDNQWKTLGSAMPYFEEKANQEIKERNFLAHGGFERNMVLVKKEDNRVLFKYDKDKLEIVKRFLFKNL